MTERKVTIDKFNQIPCTLVSTVFDHCDEGLEIVTRSHSDAEYFSIDKHEAFDMLKLIISHFKKRELTSDEIDVITQLMNNK